jgi:hypothetical protein
MPAFSTGRAPSSTIMPAAAAPPWSTPSATEVLELVDVEIEVDALGLGDGGTRLGGLREGGGEEGADQMRRALAEGGLREVGDQHAPPVHDLAEIERRAGLADDMAQDRGESKASTLFCTGGQVHCVWTQSFRSRDRRI